MPPKQLKLVYNLRFFVYTAIIEIAVRLQNRICSDYRKGAVMRKPASCVLSIALSLVLSVGLIPSPAFAAIGNASEPTVQSNERSNDNATSASSNQDQQLAQTPSTEPEANSESTESSNQFDTPSANQASSESPVVDWTTYGTCEWMITSNGTLIIRPANGAATGELGAPIASQGTLSVPVRPWFDRRYDITAAVANGCITGDLSGLFVNLTLMKSVDISSLDTSQATNMSSMFYCCKALTELDLSHLNTTNVTDMSNMFNGCSAITTLDTSTFDTSQVTNMSNMFQGCSNLQTAKVAGLDTKNVTSMGSLFAGCCALQAIDCSNFNTSSVTDLRSMFTGCETLQTIDLSSFNTPKVSDVSFMFDGCKQLRSINLSSFDASNISYFQTRDSYGYPFSQCPSLQKLTVSASTKWQMPNPGGNGSTGKWVNADTGAAYDPDSVPKNTAATYIAQINIDDSFFDIDLADETYAGGNSITKTIASELVENVDYTVEYQDNVNAGTATMTINGIGRCLGSITKNFAINKADPYWPHGWHVDIVCGRPLSSVELQEGYTWNDPNAHIDNPGSYTYYATYTPEDTANYNILDNIAFYVNAVKVNGAPIVDWTQFGTCEWQIGADGVLTIRPANKLCGELGDFSAGSPWWRYSDSINRVVIQGKVSGDVSGGGPGSSFNCSLFGGLTKMRTCDLSGLDTSNSTSLQGMFWQCTSLEDVDLTSLNTSRVTNMSMMFAGCKNLRSVNMTGIDTSHVTDFSYLFRDCSSLSNIDTAYLNTLNALYMTHMFANTGISTIDLSNLDTSNAKSMDGMFSACKHLKKIDLSSFDMSKLGEKPDSFFYNCPSLERITVGDKCAVSFPEPGGSRATGNWINTVSNEIYAPINVPANVAATYESQLDVTQFPFFYNPDDVTYMGSPIEKKVTSTLKQGRDYTVAYANNTKVGTATITIAGAGRYAGSMELPYDIVKATPSYPEVKGLTATCGQKLSDIALPEGFAWEGDASATVDTPGWPTYTATYTPADTANYSTVSGIEITVHATQPIDASMFSIEDTDIRYTGNPVMPTVTSSTVPSNQYTVTYENNVAIGQATAIVTANNQNYSGTCKIPFEIKPTNAAANYQHSTTAQSGDIMLTVQWNDPKLGQETTFHVSATGGSGAYQFRMDAPTYMDPDGSSESVADPSRNQWLQYTGECASRDYQFEMTASGTYYLRFYLMDKTAGVYYLRANVFASANDDAYPAVSTIVKSAVDKCNADTDGCDYARALWLHDWTLDQLEYDHDLNWCSAESGLTRHQGTCESYQRIYAKLLDAAGIANGRITGNGHTWNAVKIDDKWCQMDLTWDDTNDNWYGDLDQRHLYFGLTDELMAIAHSDHTANYQAEGYAYRSTDLSDNYFVRNGKADEWASQYADRIQQHLDAKETEFSIDADNQSFPPSISGMQNGVVAYAINQCKWQATGAKVNLVATSNVTEVSNSSWSTAFDCAAKYLESNPDDPAKFNGYFTVQSALSGGSALDVASGSLDPMANIRLWAPNGTSAQVFRFRYDEAAGAYEITNAKSGLALDVQGGAAQPGRNVQQYTRNGTAAQRWQVADNGDGTVTIASAKDPACVLDAAGGKSTPGTNVHLYSANGTTAQKWRLAGSSSALEFNGYFTVQSALSGGSALDVASGSLDPMANIRLWAPNGTSAQVFRFRYDEAAGAYEITNAKSGLALDVQGGAAQPGRNVQQYTRNGTAAQRWQVADNGDGTVTIASAKDPACVLDAAGGKSTPGTNVHLYSANGTTAQKWRLIAS